MVTSILLSTCIMKQSRGVKKQGKTKKQGSIHDLHAVATEHNKETMFDPAWHSIMKVCVWLLLFFYAKKSKDFFGVFLLSKMFPEDEIKPMLVGSK